MAQVTIYGASDDLIEVEGDLSDEFNVYEAKFLHFNEGTVLRVEYGKDGIWHIERVKTGTAAFAHKSALKDNEDDYSDLVTLTGDLKRVTCCDGIDGPSREEMLEALQDHDWRDESNEKLAKVCDVLGLF